MGSWQNFVGASFVWIARLVGGRCWLTYLGISGKAAFDAFDQPGDRSERMRLPGVNIHQPAVQFPGCIAPAAHYKTKGSVRHLNHISSLILRPGSLAGLVLLSFSAALPGSLPLYLSENSGDVRK